MKKYNIDHILTILFVTVGILRLIDCVSDGFYLLMLVSYILFDVFRHIVFPYVKRKKERNKTD